MKRNPFLLTAIAAAIISSLLLTSCRSDKITNSDNQDFYAQNSSASEAVSVDSNSGAKNSLRTVTEVPAGKLSDTDEFLRGIWVDENGFVANFTKNGRQSIFDDIDVHDIIDEISDKSSDDNLKKISITAKDADTIEIVCDDTSYTAYHAYSAKGQQLIEKFQNSVLGEWAICNSGYEQTINIKKYNLLTTFKNELADDIYTVRLEGVKLRMTLLGSTDGFARLDGDKLIFIFSYSDMVSSCTLIKKDSDEYNELTDAGSALDGVWVDPDDLNTTLTFFAGKSLSVTGNAFKEVLGENFDSLSGKTYDISARYKNDIINVYSGDDTLFSIVIYGSDILAVFADSNDRYPRILFYRENSDEIKRAKETQKLEKEKADLLSAYPDNDNWLNNAECGDILSLTDKDYIDKCVKNGYFTAGTPQELASFVYYVNTQPVEQGQLSLVLTADIDLSDYKWAPMGWSGGSNSDHPFSFCVYGENHKIKYMTIYSDYSNAGFIGRGTVCGVFDLDIENAIVTGNDNVGILTGQAIMGNFQNCHVSGTVNGSRAGSLLGYEANCDKENCTADVEVNGKKFDFLSWNEQQKSEIKIDDPVTITIDENYTVTRPEVTNYTNLGWMVYEDGKEMLHRNAENELSYCYFGNESGHSYEIYLSAYVKGQYVPISNIIKYTVK